MAGTVDAVTPMSQIFSTLCSQAQFNTSTAAADMVPSPVFVFVILATHRRIDPLQGTIFTLLYTYDPFCSFFFYNIFI